MILGKKRKDVYGGWVLPPNTWKTVQEFYFNNLHHTIRVKRVYQLPHQQLPSTTTI